MEMGIRPINPPNQKLRVQPMRDLALVSILVPIRNEEAFLRQCVAAIQAQDYPHLEILLIDGDSDDQTPAIIAELQQHDPRIQHLHNPARRQSKALNIGLAAAQGEYIVRVDGHTLLTPDYVRHAVDLLQAGRADNVGGKQVAIGKGLMGQAIALAYGSRFAVPSAYRTMSEDTYTDTVFLGAWRREYLQALGGWNEQYLVHEDYELNYRSRRSGGRILLTMRMQSSYYCRDSLQAVWRQYFRYGRDKVKMARDFPDSLRVRHLAAPLFVAGAALGWLPGLLFSPLLYLWAAVVLLYLAVNSLVAWTLASNQTGLFWRLWLIFPSIHLAWGIGFWVGWIWQPKLL
jgi:glycosyltransferase involved in cell wall biosynthesis